MRQALTFLIVWMALPNLSNLPGQSSTSSSKKKMPKWIGRTMTRTMTDIVLEQNGARNPERAIPRHCLRTIRTWVQVRCEIACCCHLLADYKQIGCSSISLQTQICQSSKVCCWTPLPQEMLPLCGAELFLLCHRRRRERMAPMPEQRKTKKEPLGKCLEC